LYLLAFYAVFVGFEVGSVYALWAGERNGVEWPKQMYGWITSALLIIGLLPQYYEIYKLKRVVGISILFMLVDIFGGVFSGVSLFFRKEFDSTAFVQYFLVVVLDGIVVVLKPILDWRWKRIEGRKAMQAADEEAALGEDSPTDEDKNGSDNSTQVGDAEDESSALAVGDKKTVDKTYTFASGRTLTMGSEGTAAADEVVADKDEVVNDAATAAK
jgi:uncharacterized protein with PQ loop repeat